MVKSYLPITRYLQDLRKGLDQVTCCSSGSGSANFFLIMDVIWAVGAKTVNDQHGPSLQAGHEVRRKPAVPAERDQHLNVPNLDRQFPTDPSDTKVRCLVQFFLGGHSHDNPAPIAGHSPQNNPLVIAETSCLVLIVARVLPASQRKETDYR